MDLIKIMACVALAMKADPVEIPRVVQVDDLGGDRGIYECRLPEIFTPPVLVADYTQATIAHEFAHAIQVQGWGVSCEDAGNSVWEAGAYYVERKCKAPE